MAYVKNYQLDPVTDEIIHVDLFKVTKGEKIKTAVPIIVTGTAKGIIMGGVVEWSERSVEIECLPKDLPESIGVDVTDVGVGESIHIGDLELAEELTILTNLNSVIVSVHIPKVKEEVVEEVEGEEIEGEEEDGEKSEDGSDASKDDSKKDSKKD